MRAVTDLVERITGPNRVRNLSAVGMVPDWKAEKVGRGEWRLWAAFRPATEADAPTFDGPLDMAKEYLRDEWIADARDFLREGLRATQ